MNKKVLAKIRSSYNEFRETSLIEGVVVAPVDGQLLGSLGTSSKQIGALGLSYDWI